MQSLKPTILFLSLLVAMVSSSFIPFEPLEYPSTAEQATAGSTTNVQISSSGDILAVGSEQAIHVYQLQRHQRTWELLDTMEVDGDIFSLSGYKIAVQHDDRIQVYSISPKTGLSIEGTAVPRNTISECPVIQLTPSGFLVVGCPEMDNTRGQVEIYIRMKDLSWKSMMTLRGQQPGDAFGAQVMFDDDRQETSFFRMAIFSAGERRVHVYDMDLRLAANQEDLSQALVLLGDVVTDVDQLMSMSSRTLSPTLAVTSLDGSLRVIALNENAEWTPVAAELGTGTSAEEVSMTRDAARIATCSNDLLTVYELQNDQVYRPILEDASSCSGTALNAVGSLVIATRDDGSVVTMLDHTAFCRVPSNKDEATAFLERQQCRDFNGNLAESQQQCSGLFALVRGDPRLCVWQEDLPTFAPTLAPVTLSPTHAFLGTTPPAGSPTEATLASTSKPTVEQSNFPTASPSAVPSLAPTSLEVDGCRCDSEGNCVEGPLVQGTPLLLRIFANNNNFAGLQRVSLLVLEQGSSRVVVHDETDVYFRRDENQVECEAKECRVTIPTVHALFFNKENIDSLAVIGKAALETRRNLRHVGRTVAATVDFEFTVFLEKSSGDGLMGEETKENRFMSWLFWIVLILAAFMAVGCCWFRFSRRETREHPK